jgi:hypothetical protein
MTVKITNNAWGTLAVGVNDSDTTLLLGTAQGDRFPTLPANNALKPVDCFYVTLIDESTNEVEIVRVIERNVDVLSVVRSQDGSRRKQFLAGSRVELRPVAALFNSKKDAVEAAEDKQEILDKIGLLEREAKEGIENAVQKGEQNLTDGEQAQARENIGAMSLDTDEEANGSKTWLKPQFHKNNVVLLQRSEDKNSFALIGRMAENDAWIIRGIAENIQNGANNTWTTTDNGALELATADNGTEPIYVTQYSGGKIPDLDQVSIEGWDGCFGEVLHRAVILDRSGNTFFPGVVYGSSFQATSDRRLKFGFEEVAKESVLDAITPYRYGRLDKHPKERFIGVIAQDVQEVIPEAVREDGNGYLSVDYAALTAVLWGEVKRLKNEIKEIKDGMRKETLQTEQKDALQEAVQEVLVKPAKQVCSGRQTKR